MRRWFGIPSTLTSGLGKSFDRRVLNDIKISVIPIYHSSLTICLERNLRVLNDVGIKQGCVGGEKCGYGEKLSCNQYIVLVALAMKPVRLEYIPSFKYDDEGTNVFLRSN